MGRKFKKNWNRMWCVCDVENFRSENGKLRCNTCEKLIHQEPIA